MTFQSFFPHLSLGLSAKWACKSQQQNFTLVLSVRTGHLCFGLTGVRRPLGRFKKHECQAFALQVCILDPFHVKSIADFFQIFSVTGN